MAIAKPEGCLFQPTLILVGTRLGIDKINPIYWESLVATLQMPQAVGIAGYVQAVAYALSTSPIVSQSNIHACSGRPSSSHYFVGAQRSSDSAGHDLFFLDPHHTRPALPYRQKSEDYSQADLDTCHTRRLRRLHIREMDPSMLIGFLIKDEDDWENWKTDVKHVQGKAVVSVYPHDPALGKAPGREGAIDEVETFSDDDGDTVLDI